MLATWAALSGRTCVRKPWCQERDDGWQIAHKLPAVAALVHLHPIGVPASMPSAS